MTGLTSTAIAQPDAPLAAAPAPARPAEPPASIPATGDNGLPPGAAPETSAPVPGSGEVSTDMLMRAMSDPLAKPLIHRIDVTLDKATIEQVAEVLSKAGNVDIIVDKAVPIDKIVTLNAREQPLYHVMEEIALNLKLVVAKRGNGLVFKLPPMLSIGEPEVLENPLPPDPWDDDLRGLVEAIRTLQLPLENLTSGAAQATSRGPRQARWPQANGDSNPSQLASAASAGVAMTGIGADMLAVAEPGRGMAGEPGYWLTIYRISGDKMTKVTTKFHAAHSPK